jgi:hypothetical protein
MKLSRAGRETGPRIFQGREASTFSGRNGWKTDARQPPLERRNRN